MKRISSLNEHGLALWFSVVSLLALGVLATFLGKEGYQAIKARQRMEAKVSIIDNETTLLELISAGFLKVARTADFCKITKTKFQEEFNKARPVFPAPALELKLENPPNVTHLNRFKDSLLGAQGITQGISTAINQCLSNSGLQIPNETEPGVYAFCIALDGSDVSPQNSRSFVFSESSFVQVRLELAHKELSQETKTMGPAPLCSNWLAQSPNNRQIRVTYQIFWKVRNDRNGFYRFAGTKLLNIAELRPL